MRPLFQLAAVFAAAIAAPSSAQLGLPGVSVPPLPSTDRVMRGTIEGALESVRENTGSLLAKRLERVDDLLRRHRDLIEPDASGNPSRRGELLLIDPDPTALHGAATAGFATLSIERMEELGLTVVRLRAPKGVGLADAEAMLQRIMPGSEIATDSIHFQSGVAVSGFTAALAARATGIATPVGMIDGSPGKDSAVRARRGFAKGAPIANDHGSAIASLLSSAGVDRILAADVYGSDPAGGNSLAIVRAMDWLMKSGARVITISLVGPRNAVLEKAVAAARKRDAVVVAAVGNDGPAAPPAYPASYPGVVAVTAVDGRLRPLFEAGRALHLDYAAPGADMRAASKSGKLVKVRGTSFAAPLVAARVAAALEHGDHWRAALDREAEDLGPKGADTQYGRGLLCRRCPPR